MPCPGEAAADRQGHERGVSQRMQADRSGCLLSEPLQPALPPTPAPTLRLRPAILGFCSLTYGEPCQCPN